MKKSRNISIFIFFFALFTTVVFVFFGSFYLRVIDDITTDYDREFMYADFGDDGKNYFLEYYDDSLSVFSSQDLKLRLVTLDGTAYSERNLTSTLPKDVVVEQFYAGFDGTVMISCYERNHDGDERTAYNYVLYCLKPGATGFDTLISLPCAGMNLAEAKRNVRPSSITGDFDTDHTFIINMFIKKDTICTKYSYREGVLISNGTFVHNGEMIGGSYCKGVDLFVGYIPVKDLAMLSDSNGTLYTVYVDADGKPQIDITPNFYGIDFTYFGVYTDRLTGNLRQIGNAETIPLPINKLDKSSKIVTAVDYGYNIGNSNGDGGVLAVYNYNEISFAKMTGGMDNLGNFEDYTKYLPNTRIQSILIMFGTVVGLLIISYAFYYLFCIKQQLYFPIALRHMLSMSVCLFWFVTIMYGTVIWSVYTLDVASGLSRYADTIYAETASGDTPTNILPNVSKFSNLSYFQLYNDSGTWRVQNSSESEYTPGFSVDSYELSFLKSGINPDKRTENTFFSYHMPTEAYKWLIYKDNDSGVFVLVGDESIALGFYSDLLLTMYIACGVVVLLSAFLTRGTSRAISRVAKGIGKIATSEGQYKIVHNSYDELQSFALTVNNFAGGIYEKLAESRKIRDSYLKFIPYHILRIMEIDSATEADKTKVSTRYLTLMSVHFRFPGGIYQNQDSQALFDSINEIMADASKVISERNGAVYNVSYDSFDVVFDGESSDAVAAAVALRQEVIADNKIRAEAGRESITLCIAIEKGDAIMGFVDSDAHVVPTIVSLGLNLTRAMIETALLIGANIICTDVIANAASAYSARYIGKISHSTDGIKIYELFDGDLYDERSAKEKTRRLFAEGLQKFYGRDFSGAKRVFMDIVHKFPEDSVNRHYLYLSDVLEKEAAENVYIDYKSIKTTYRRRSSDT
ncbi:hypothetical protein FACS1894133_1760 [Clostridia bacterium]|nr:hypothetical protein FACS1894133_1760 [Clostridia bacterium]